MDLKLTDPKIPGDFQCITDNPCFQSTCLNIWTLKVAFMTYKHFDVNINVTRNE